MKRLKSHSFALLLTTLVVILSIPFGAHRSLNAVRSEALAVLSAPHSITTDLQIRRDTAANLYTVAEKYLPGDSPALRTLKSALNGGDAAITAGAGAVAAALADYPLTDKDAQYVASFQAELTSRAFSIQNDPYNDLAEQFNSKTLKSFPVFLLRPVLFIDDLEVYR